MTDLLLAVEAGGTKFRVAVFDADLNELADTRIDTTTPDQTLAGVTAFADQQSALGTWRAIGVASFGPIIVDRASTTYGSIGATPKVGWTGAPILSTITDHLGVPGDIQTDVEAAAVAEQKLGSARNDRAVAYITVGTGIGAAVAIDGEPVRGRSHSEIGHVPVRRRADDTYAGHCPFHGDCLEGMASGPAIEDRWQVSSGTELDGRPEVWETEADYLAQAARVLNYTFAPDRIVFGGGVGGRESLLPMLRAQVIEDFAEYAVHHDDLVELVVQASLPDAGMTGAALLAHSVWQAAAS